MNWCLIFLSDIVNFADSLSQLYETNSEHERIGATETHGKPDLLALTTVSREWNYAATPWLYRCISLDFALPGALWTARLLKGLLDTESQVYVNRLYIQHLMIKNTSSIVKGGDVFKRGLPNKVLSLLVKLVTKLPNLISFGYTSSIY